MKMHLSLTDTDEGVRQTKQVERHATCKAVLLLLPTGVQLSLPNMICLHFSVTHRSIVTPVAPPASSRRASPLCTAGSGFQCYDSNLLQLSKMSSENSVSVVISQVRAITTDISLVDRQLETWHSVEYTKSTLTDESDCVEVFLLPTRSRQDGDMLTCSL